MSRIEQAIILAAGAGTRLREASASKPLCHVAGRALIEHAIAGLAGAGVERIIVVTGYQAELVETHLAGVSSPAVEVVRTADWRHPNGVSALAAAALAGDGDSLLLMADHLVDPMLYGRVAQHGAGPGLCLAVDRRLGHPWIDPDDVTRVRTQGDSIVAIGKHMADHDCYDTGVFAVGPAFFSALASLDQPSLSDAVTLLAGQGRAQALDSGGLDWIDVDDPRALAIAERWLRDGPSPLPALGSDQNRNWEAGCA